MAVLEFRGMKVFASDPRFPPFVLNNFLHLRCAEDIIFYPGKCVRVKISGRFHIPNGHFGIISDSNYKPQCLKGVASASPLYGAQENIEMEFRLDVNLPEPVFIPAGTPFARLRLCECTFPGCAHESQDCL